MAHTRRLAFHHAHAVAVAVICEAENRDKYLTAHHAARVDEEFRKLAQSLGYRVEPMTEQEDAAA